MGKRSKLSFLLIILISLSSACNLPQGEDVYTTPDVMATMVAATAINMIEQTTLQAKGGMLPSPLYFLSDENSESIQLWRLNQDTLAVTRVTDESTDISDYAISPSDGRVAYISNNQLLLADSDGANPTVLIEGDKPSDTDVYSYQQKIAGLAWSPDGNMLAYGKNGVVLYNIQDDTKQRLIKNELDKTDNGSLLPINLYNPLSWSPDGTKLLVGIGWMEAGTLGVLDPVSGSMVQMGRGVVCCQATWLPDSSGILVSSTVIGMVESGLWRYRADNGEQSVLIPTTSEDNTLNFVGWPFILPNGNLFYFYNNMADFPEEETPLTLVHSAADGVSDRIQLRPETWQIYEALWTPDGSKVIAVQPPLGEQNVYPRRGPIVMIDISGSLVQPLAPSGYNLQWGQ